jgi:hypothetical protein
MAPKSVTSAAIQNIPQRAEILRPRVAVVESASLGATDCVDSPGVIAWRLQPLEPLPRAIDLRTDR